MRTRHIAGALAVLAGAIAIASPGALAGRATTRAAPRSCDDAKTTLAMTTCLSGALGEAEDQLRAAYAKARASASRAADRELLSASQRAWFSFRASDCEYAASFFRGGTFAPVERLQCRLNRTKRRLADVRGYARRLTGCGLQLADRSRAHVLSAC